MRERGGQCDVKYSINLSGILSIHMLA